MYHVSHLLQITKQKLYLDMIMIVWKQKDTHKHIPIKLLIWVMEGEKRQGKLSKEVVKTKKKLKKQRMEGELCFLKKELILETEQAN